MHKEMLEELKKKNKNLEETLNQPFQERVKKINKYLSRYLYSLLGISITGSLLALAVFFTPWLPSVATALTAVFTAIISALALPLLITIPIITVAFVLAPIAGFLWKKHQANSELSNSFEKLKKSLDSLEKLKGNEFDDEFDDESEDVSKTKNTEIRLRQALCIHEFLATQKGGVEYNEIDRLLVECRISAEWIYAVDLVLKDLPVPENQDDLDNRYADQVDGPNSTINQGTGVDKFLLNKPLDITILKKISISGKSEKEKELNQQEYKPGQNTQYTMFSDLSVKSSTENFTSSRLSLKNN